MAHNEFSRRMPASDLIFRSADGRFGLHVPWPEVARVLELCGLAFPRETGGILVGAYNEALNSAEVSTASGPGRDARAGRTWFERGVAGLQELLGTFWRERRGYYLGEWHFHPGGAPVPSPTDRRSLRGFATSSLYCCPEPVLLIIGGNPNDRWTASATVYPRGAPDVALELLRDAEL